jgi:catechol 2,3-dioxygenase-like lactoylglutathione lyase family enzyme
MPTAFDLVTVDTPDPDRLAAFWREALGLVEVEREDGDRWVVLAEPLTGTRRLGLQRGSHRPGGVHLDLRCAPAELPDELVRLRTLGAVELAPARLEPYGAIVNLADPDGNAFDLCAYH